jgi:pSer/pThr/pTyr-binding forkhead associated (FHA) protein
MSQDHTGVFGRPDENERTHVVFAEDHARLAPSDQPLGPRAAFLVAYERLSLLAGVAGGPAVVVAAVDPDARVIASLQVRDRRALIIGRHTRCGLRLPAGVVSLRHVAALVRFEGARPVIHLRDLATGHPFLTEDGQPNAGVIADGPLYASIGGYALWFVPCQGPGAPPWGRRAEEAWSTLAPRSFLDRRPPGEGLPGAPMPAPRPARPRAAIHDEITSVTHLGPPLLLDDGDDPEIAWGTLRLSDGTRREKRAISAERLERGVLLGRYGRCSILLATPENTVSRVHALLVRLGAEVWIIDTASTNGTKRGEDDVSAEVLRDADTLSLGREITLSWQRIQHPEA